MREYVPHRHRFVISLVMTASVGFGFFASKAATAMICPGWQYPHSGTSPSRHASCTGCVPPSPSIVVTSCPTTWPAPVWHDRTAFPFTWTVHAPPIPTPHPYFVPVRPIVSRITHKSGVSASTSTANTFPLTLSESMATPPRSHVTTQLTFRRDDCSIVWFFDQLTNLKSELDFQAELHLPRIQGVRDGAGSGHRCP